MAHFVFEAGNVTKAHSTKAMAISASRPAKNHTSASFGFKPDATRLLSGRFCHDGASSLPCFVFYGASEKITSQLDWHRSRLQYKPGTKVTFVN